MNDILKQNMITELGLDSLPAKEQEEAIGIMGKLLFQAIIIRVFEVMSDEEKEDFERLLSNNTADSGEVYDFLSTKVSDLDGMIREEVASLKEQAKEFMAG